MNSLWTEYQNKPPLPSGLAKLRFRISAINSCLDVLKSTGLEGMAVPTGRASELKHYTWEQYRDEQQQKLQKYESSRVGTSR